jgi:hypothetical protein
MTEPHTFCVLLGKILPTQVTGDAEAGPVRFEFSWLPPQSGVVVIPVTRGGLRRGLYQRAWVIPGASHTVVLGISSPGSDELRPGIRKRPRPTAEGKPDRGFLLLPLNESGNARSSGRPLADGDERCPECGVRLISFALVDQREQRLAHGLGAPSSSVGSHPPYRAGYQLDGWVRGNCPGRYKHARTPA